MSAHDRSPADVLGNESALGKPPVMKLERGGTSLSGTGHQNSFVVHYDF